MKSRISLWINRPVTSLYMRLRKLINRDAISTTYEIYHDALKFSVLHYSQERQRDKKVGRF